MKFSTRVNKSYESRLIYEQLEEDNPIIYLLFALCNYIALKETLKQGKQILEDLKRGIIHEIPNYNVKEVTKIENYIRTGKFRYDMMQLAKNKEKIIELLKAFFDDIMETTTEDLNSKVEALLLELIKIIKKIDAAFQVADPNIFENCFPQLMNQFDWTETILKYQAEKHKRRVTMDWLQEEQEQELQRLLLLDVMCNVKKPSYHKLGSVDYEYHKSLLPCDFKDYHNYQVAYTKFMTQYATRKEELIIPQLDEYGKYIALNFYKFRPEQQKALYGFIKKLELIHRDMVALKPELENHLMSSKSLVSLENTKLFAPYFHISKMLKQEWFKKLRVDAKYDDEWADRFAESLMRSEYGIDIAETWKENRCQIMGYLLGCLKNAGVIKADASNDRIASEAGIMDNWRTFGGYIGKKSQEQPYSEWVVNNVDKYC